MSTTHQPPGVTTEASTSTAASAAVIATTTLLPPSGFDDDEDFESPPSRRNELENNLASIGSPLRSPLTIDATSERLLSDELLSAGGGGGSGGGDGPSVDGDQFSRTLSSVDLLALKVDHNLMAGLERWLAKYNMQMPSSLVTQIDEMDLCPDESRNGLRRACF